MKFKSFCDKFERCIECPLEFLPTTSMCEQLFEEAMNNGGKFTIDITNEVEE